MHKDFNLEDFLKMDYLISNSLFWSFKLQINFESLQSISCVRFLNDIVWLLYVDINSVSLIPKLSSVDNSLVPSWFQLQLYRKFCRSILTIFNIYCLMGNCFYSYNWMFYHLFRCKNLLWLLIMFFILSM